jgi:hypothetical protein
MELIKLAATIGIAIKSVPFVLDLGVGYKLVPHLGHVRILVNLSVVRSVSFQVNL